MAESLFTALTAGLSIWKNKDARKYLDRVLSLKKEWYNEYNKQTPDDAVLDFIEFELHLISEAFSSKVGAENTKAQ